ncbi:hypothetical protein NIES2104_40980 [Leptolyngbya sp. NIES-2104]|nr:hypothetical protein NIES2104_40980 [Leptolyngbya sp. NIES-2104]
MVILKKMLPPWLNGSLETESSMRGSTNLLVMQYREGFAVSV